MMQRQKRKPSSAEQGNDMSLLREKLIICLAVVGISLSGIFAKLYDAPSMYIVLMRLLFSTLLISVPYIVSLKKERECFSPRIVGYTALAGTMLALHFFCFFESVRLASVASGTLLINTSVFFVPAIMFVAFGERLSRKAIFGIALSFVGSAIIAMGDSAAGSNVLLGDVLAIFGALCEAVYMIMGMLCRRRLSTTAYTGSVYSFATIVAFILVMLLHIPLTGYGVMDYGSALGMALFCTLMGHSVLSRGLKFVSPSFVSTSKLAEPVYAAIIALFLFAEVPSVSTVVGGVIIIAGVLWNMKYQN